MQTIRKATDFEGRPYGAFQPHEWIPANTPVTGAVLRKVLQHLREFVHNLIADYGQWKWLWTVAERRIERSEKRIERCEKRIERCEKRIERSEKRDGDGDCDGDGLTQHESKSECSRQLATLFSEAAAVYEEALRLFRVQCTADTVAELTDEDVHLWSVDPQRDDVQDWCRLLAARNRSATQHIAWWIGLAAWFEVQLREGQVTSASTMRATLSGLMDRLKHFFAEAIPCEPSLLEVENEEPNQEFGTISQQSKQSKPQDIVIKVEDGETDEEGEEEASSGTYNELIEEKIQDDYDGEDDELDQIASSDEFEQQNKVSLDIDMSTEEDFEVEEELNQISAYDELVAQQNNVSLDIDMSTDDATEDESNVTLSESNQQKMLLKDGDDEQDESLIAIANQIVESHQLANRRVLRRGKRRHQCLVCNKAFEFQSLLIRHQVQHTDEKPYQCDECGKQFRQRASLVEHERLHTGEKPFQCDKCGQEFIRRSNLNQHRRIHFKPKRKKKKKKVKRLKKEAAATLDCDSSNEAKRCHRCEECGQTFAFQSHLMRHQLKHTGEKPYQCGECGKRFTQRASQVEHERLHTGEKPYRCDLCGLGFVRRSNLNQHRRIHQRLTKGDDVQGEPALRADAASDETLPREREMDATNRAHLKARHHRCQECGMAFVCNSHLMRHQLKHTGEKPYECATCGKQFAQQATLAEHERVHTGEKPYRCDQCGMCFVRRSNLNQHRRVHDRRNDGARGENGIRTESSETLPKITSSVTGECSSSSRQSVPSEIDANQTRNEHPFQCEECDKTFRFQSILNRHQLMHMGVKPFQCEHCGRCFSQRQTLVQHENLHTGERPYRCEQCGKCYRQRATLAEHRRIHTGQKPYQCAECGQRFMRRSHWVQHCRAHRRTSDAEWMQSADEVEPSADRRYKCDHCGQCFAGRNHLSNHCRIHVNDGESHRVAPAPLAASVGTGHRKKATEKPHKCDQCGKAYKFQSELSRHQVLHTDAKPYQCEQCGKTFRQRVSLTEHRRVHTGEKPYRCEHCGQCFVRKSNLNQHCKTHFKQGKSGRGRGRTSESESNPSERQDGESVRIKQEVVSDEEEVEKEKEPEQRYANEMTPSRQDAFKHQVGMCAARIKTEVE